MTVCLVVGGAGFIGSHLAEALIRRGSSVRVLDNFSTGTLANLASIRHKIEVVFGDMSDLGVLRQASEGVDLVFHEVTPEVGHMWAAAADVRVDSRETGILHVLIAAHEAHVKRVIFASTSLVYPAALTPLNEHAPTQPATAYGTASVAGEQQCVAFTSHYGLETVRLRYFDVYGPRQPVGNPYGNAVLNVLKAMLLGRNPVIHGDGRQPQDLICVDDVVHATLLAAEAPRLAGKVYNVGRGRAVTALEVVAAINAILKIQLVPFHTPLGPEEALHNRIADMSRAEADLGFCPSTSLDQGLQRWINELGSWRAEFVAAESSDRAPQIPAAASEQD